MWYYLRKFLKLLGGKVMSKMAPRLIFFQYYNRAGLELEEKKKKFKLHYRLPTQILIEKSFRTNSSKKLGISSVLEQGSDNAQVNALGVNDGQVCWDDKTISSHFEEDNILDQSWEFVEMEIIAED